ncbi:MAG: hypothetical protein JKY37_18420 [Nannocystaceae bacterium]|nr:hypothetical protein [Nannocystaceae bacterium]
MTTAGPPEAEADALDGNGVPGGYWGPTDTREPQPSDGRRKILIGSIVAPLGLLAGTTGAVFTYLSVPEHCVQRYAGIGIDVQRSRCGGLLTLNAIRTGYGALMVVTGVVFLALGLSEKKERREWDSRHSSAWRRGRRVTFAPSAGGWALKF